MLLRDSVFFSLPLNCGYLLAYLTARFLIRKFHLNVPGQAGFDDESSGAETKVTEGTPLAETILEALGGKENIKELDVCATRLRVQVYDHSKVNKDAFKATGAAGVLNVGDSLQIVYGTNATLICDQIKAVMNK